MYSIFDELFIHFFHVEIHTCFFCGKLVPGDFKVVFFEKHAAEDMGGGVVAHELVSSVPVKGTVEGVTFGKSRFVDFVADGALEFAGVDYVVCFTVLCGEGAGVPFYAAAFGVECGFVKDDEFFVRN